MTAKLDKMSDWVEVNGERHPLPEDLSRPATQFLRDGLGLTGTKVGCGQGDCGSCTIVVDGEPVYACITPVAQLRSRRVLTVEGLASGSPCGRRLQQSLLAHQAVQCGFCIPGMLMSACAAIDAGRVRDRADAEEALEGVLCRCTGYRKIVDAVLDVAIDAEPRPLTLSDEGRSVGRPLTRLDGDAKVTGLPSTYIWPSLGVCTPDSVLISVDLPAPLSPSRQCTSPALTVSDTPASATTGPKCLTSSCTSISGRPQPSGRASPRADAASATALISVLPSRAGGSNC